MSELTFEDYLRNLRDHPDEGVRANAAWRLGRTRDHRCLAALLAAASDPSPAVRARVMEALGSRREPEVTPAIAQGLHDADPDVRAMAARAAALMAATELRRTCSTCWRIRLSASSRRRSKRWPTAIILKSGRA